MKYPEEMYIGSQIFEGDRDGSESNFSEKIVKTKKKHNCCVCEKEIPSGTKMLMQRAVVQDMGWCSCYICLPCVENWLEESGQVEVAKEYGNASDNDSMVVSALPSLYPLKPFEEEAIHKVIASARNGEWIPTEKELPQNGTYVYVTCHSHVDDGPDWVAQSFYFNDKWGIPLVDCGKAEVIAWMEEKHPAPYQKECVNVK